MSYDSYLELDITSLEYLQYYSSSNLSCSPYTTLLPDCHYVSLRDSDSQSEDSDSSSVFDFSNLDLAAQVKALRFILKDECWEHIRDKKEMLRLHKAMVWLVI